MIRFSACIDMMFSRLDFYDRFAAAASCGIGCVEFWKWTGKDPDRVEEELLKNGLSLSVFNLDSQNEALSRDLSRGILADGRREEFLSAFYESLPVYRKLRAGGMIVLLGETREGQTWEEQRERALDCLLAVRPYAEREGVNLLVEPLNTTDRKNYCMPYSAPVFDLLEEVGSPRIRMLFDIYHQQMTEGHLSVSIREHIGEIGHFHVADVPGRHEPGTGEISYPHLFALMEELHYGGYVGLEYRATGRDEDTVGFVKGWNTGWNS